ncbi:MAG: hypothetical protein HYU66_08420 [Armatimonadetes bacterium]|nr:hypothetical protein [Armatimonadota bacterium]
MVFRKELGAVLLSLKEWVHFRIKRKDFEVQLDRVNQELDQAERKVAQAERQLPASESGQADVEDEPDADQDRLTGDEPLEPPLDAG